MMFKLIGAVFIIAACGGLGYKIAAGYLREERVLRQLIRALDYMECELQYRLTPLPMLCRQAALEVKDVLPEVFYSLAAELENQISPNAEQCMSAVLCKVSDIPSMTKEALSLLGHSIGRFDLSGQLTGLEGVRRECRRNLEILNNNKEIRIRGYQTLGLCAGAALVILFI